MNAPILRTVLLRLAVLLVPAAALQALLPIVVRGPLDLGSGAYGALLACFGVGAAGGAVVRPRIEERLSYDAMVVWSSLLIAGALVVQGYADLARRRRRRLVRRRDRLDDSAHDAQRRRPGHARQPGCGHVGWVCTCWC